MVEDSGRAGRDDRTDALVERVLGERGKMMALEVSGPEVDEFVQRLDLALDVAFGGTVSYVGARMVLGSACTTAAKAVDQIVAALQLPYSAARGWGDLLDALGDRPVSRRECVVVADASQLLRHEDHDRWRELVGALHGGPYCLGGGWSTLVLADHGFAWQDWVFRSVAEVPGLGS
ncbi:barstar family protein [Actinomadura kijaniata]|uniref:barstar family protein n=1 Tax=Actinomadura kijaniata TaxID=46161 RepID=UPI000836670C|nr:barstar family protein [Actinomadura kijaniata]